MNVMPSAREIIAHLLHPRQSNNQRPRILHPEGFLVFFLIMMSFSTVLQVVERVSTKLILGYSSQITATQVIDETNRERLNLGLSPLKYNEHLAKAAEAKAQDMFANQYWAHYSPTGTSPWEFMNQNDYVYSVAGENLARDFTHTQDMVEAWMNSPTHRENIINPKYKDIGIAVVDGQFNGIETTLVVQMFGSQAVSPVAQIGEESNAIEVERIPFSGEALAETTQLSPTENIQAIAMEKLNLSNYQVSLSPLQLTKAGTLAVIILIVTVLAYDTVVADQRQLVRFVGKNFAHIAMFLTVLFLVLVFKSGVIA